jgi:hypothetical protein
MITTDEAGGGSMIGPFFSAELTAGWVPEAERKTTLVRVAV